MKSKSKDLIVKELKIKSPIAMVFDEGKPLKLLLMCGGSEIGFIKLI